MSLLSRIWWGEHVPVCWHRLWLTRCGACRAADWLSVVGSQLVRPASEPVSEADRVARRVRELRWAEDRLDALGVDQDGAA